MIGTATIETTTREQILAATVRRLERENRALVADREDLETSLARANEEIRMLRRTRDRLRARNDDKRRTIGRLRGQNDEMRAKLVEKHRDLMDDLCGREPDRPVPEASRV